MTDAASFTFFRSAAKVFAADRAPGPLTDLPVQLCGDAHLANFGGFASPERNLVVDVDDFDETLPGPFEWDLLRLAASFEIAARSNGFGSGDRESVHSSLSPGTRKRAGWATMCPRLRARPRQISWKSSSTQVLSM